MNFLDELHDYECSLCSSDDDWQLSPISKKHPLNNAATTLRKFYRSEKLPVEQRHIYRELIEETRQHAYEIKKIELNIETLFKWAENELEKIQPTSDQSQASHENITFDVFLSHNNSDKVAVRKLKQLLKEQFITAWLDESELRPGIPWQKELEIGIRCSKSIIVLVGPDGLGPWEAEEMDAGLRMAVEDKRPVIPVLLPGATKPDLPMFLGNRTWIDLSSGLSAEGISAIIWGVTGRKPTDA